MNIGSKVRLLHGKEQGVITKIKSGKYLEVDLGDGFSIEVLANEVVLISPMEARLETPSSGVTSAKSTTTTGRSAIGATPFVTKGIYLAFVPINDREVVLHLVNLTSWRLLFTIFARAGQSTQGLASGILEQSKSHQVTKLLMKDFESWPAFDTNLLYYSEDKVPEESGKQHSLRCRIQSFHKNLQKAPLLNVNAHVFQIDAESDRPEKGKLSGEQIRDSMLGKPETSKEAESFRKKAPAQIDLHIHNLRENKEGLSNAEILEIQLSSFKSYLESAIAEGLGEITIIHGVGQGTLKQEIHRLLSKHPNVAYFKEAQKEKFGYGATIAHLK